VVYAPPILVTTPGKTTQLRAIQFVQSKTELLPEAQPALEQLAAFLKNNPTTEIELSGHTDNQGDFDENVRLSKQRVDVVKAYLVANGIAASRITTRGYGPTRPIASNNAESTRQLNRRVEMTVLKQ
jgi:outer membrane protein OmpA-like peptidoglycan-associated protein